MLEQSHALALATGASIRRRRISNGERRQQGAARSDQGKIEAPVRLNAA
jgi:hypothetical protein